MNVLDSAQTAAAECTAPSSLCSSRPGFTRAQFTKDGRVHTESRCHQCGFRITAVSSEGFDNEEQEHACACRGSETE